MIYRPSERIFLHPLSMSAASHLPSFAGEVMRVAAGGSGRARIAGEKWRLGGDGNRCRPGEKA